MKLLAGEGFHVPDAVHLFSERFGPVFTGSSIAEFAVGGMTFRITAMTITMFVVTALLCVLFIAAFSNARLVPKGLQNLMEAGVDAVKENIVAPVLGHHADKWMPLLTTMFFWVFALNFLEVVPGINYPVTARMAIPAFLAGLAYIVFNAVGIAANGPLTYLKANLFPPGVPKPIYLILTPIELFSTFVFRPITQAVRLFANMMAGHMMLTIFFLASAYFIKGAHGSMFLRVMSPFPVLLSIVLTMFEVFIGLIQAFIITILTAVYIAGASESEH
jgi:F-type H+-transporting ATPase subunit a